MNHSTKIDNPIQQGTYSCNGIMTSDWVESEVLVDHKSKFQARCCSISHHNQVPLLLKELVESNKNVSKASHPHMYAWRTATILGEYDSDVVKPKRNHHSPKSKKSQKSTIPQVKNIDQGSSDNGEAGAGHRLLTLLERSHIFNVLVIVTRWYGGIPLGSARFRHISTTAVECLRKGKYLP